MKRLILTITFITASTGTFAQVYTTYGDQNLNQQELRSDIHEIRVFERELDQFSYALVAGDRRAAVQAKNHILLDMEREILETENELRWALRRVGFSAPITREQNRRRIGQMDSRGNGIQQRNREFRREIQILEDRLEKQERLYHRFEELALVHRRIGLINENEHRRIMYQFKETMRDDIIETR